IEIADQEFVGGIGAEVSGGDGVDAGRARPHGGRVLEDGYLVEFGFYRRIKAGGLEERTRPGAGGGDDYGRVDFAVLRLNAADASGFDQETGGAGFGEIGGA